MVISSGIIFPSHPQHRSHIILIDTLKLNPISISYPTELIPGRHSWSCAVVFGSSSPSDIMTPTSHRPFSISSLPLWSVPCILLSPSLSFFMVQIVECEWMCAQTTHCMIDSHNESIYPEYQQVDREVNLIMRVLPNDNRKLSILSEREKNW